MPTKYLRTSNASIIEMSSSPRTRPGGGGSPDLQRSQSSQGATGRRVSGGEVVVGGEMVSGGGSVVVGGVVVGGGSVVEGGAVVSGGGVFSQQPLQTASWCMLHIGKIA